MEQPTLHTPRFVLRALREFRELQHAHTIRRRHPPIVGDERVAPRTDGGGQLQRIGRSKRPIVRTQSRGGPQLVAREVNHLHAT